ncbi:MAG: ribonuclease D, partial [Atopobiaceae bacterium]|nr:ribonuclease D [Atopobiaceae bacterium]
MYISKYEDLAAFCDRAASSRILAVDTEFLREKTYFPKLCLIQIATHDESACVDPLAIDDLTPLCNLLTDQRITKIFHACTQDLEVIFYSLGVVAAPVFDTQLAAAFLGLRQQVGYGVLVEHYTGVRLPKADSLTDWSRRPLDEEQLAYAEDDVRYLPGIYDAMMTQLVAKDRLGWLRPEMDELADRSHFERIPEQAYLHLKRSSSLTRRQLAVAREVCAWRERRAAERNIPRKWL